MAVVVFSDALQHIPFALPRQSQWGLIDGIFNVAAEHPGSVDLVDVVRVELTFEVKADWVYVLQGLQVYREQELTSGWFVNIVVFSGPQQIGTLVPNMAYGMAGSWTQTTSNSLPVWFPTGSQANQHLALQDALLWGDKLIPGTYQLIQYEVNKPVVTVVRHGVKAWGWMVKQNTFFRGVVPRLA